MRHKTLTLLSGVVLIGLAGPAVAQAPSAPARPMAAPTTRAEALARADAAFDRLDLNRDGRVTQQEARQVRQARMQERRGRVFERLDANNDGQISRAEFDARPQVAGNGERRGGRHFGRRGGPGGRGAMAARMFGTDGVITREAFREMAGQRFDRVDANHDGTISPEERREARGRMRAMMAPPAAAPAQQ